jgi:hypothetical protein
MASLRPKTQDQVPTSHGLLRARRPGVGDRDLAAPGNEFGRAIIAVDDAFDQRRPVVVGDGRFDRFLKLPTIGSAQAAAFAVLGVERLDQSGIVPVLDVVIGAVMDLNLDGISVIVDEEMITGSFRRTICATSWAVN